MTSVLQQTVPTKFLHGPEHEVWAERPADCHGKLVIHIPFNGEQPHVKCSQCGNGWRFKYVWQRKKA